MLNLKATVRPGVGISEAVTAACKMALLVGQPIELIFNEIELTIRPGSDPEHIVRLYWEKNA